MRRQNLLFAIGVPLLCLVALAAREDPSNREVAQLKVIAYAMPRHGQAGAYDLEKLTHLCYSFLRMKGSSLVVAGARDSAALAATVALKQEHPHLKVLISFGGWAACPTCSQVFATQEGREEFARSTREILDGFHADGIDLDWEYPAVEGFPGHPYAPQDRENFTLLVKELRRALGAEYEITFAAGAFDDFLTRSVAWTEVMPLVDAVHLMTYDLVNGYSTVTGHHTPLFSTPGQIASTDHAVRFLDSVGVARSKMVIGMAFYARMWEEVDSVNHGLFRPGKFLTYVTFRNFDTLFIPAHGYTRFWDSTAAAPWAYSPRERRFATFDDERSIALKTRYALEKGLGGVMFWELNGDRTSHGLLHVIDSTRAIQVRPVHDRAAP